MLSIVINCYGVMKTMAKETQVQTNEEAEKKHVDELVARVAAAQKKYAEYTQEQVDHIFRRVALKLSSLRIPLAKMAVEETGMGVVEDKVIKNHFASEYIYNKFKNTKTCGILEEDKANGLIKIAEPLGVIAGVIPTTNPTSTAIFKSLIALKTRNGIIISPHPRAKKSTTAAAKIVLDAAVAAGAPEGITPVETSAEAPAKLGEWVETMRYSATDSAYHTVYYRITNVVRGEGAQAAVDAYNAEDHVVVFNDLESDDLEYCMIEYEVYFPADFPQADYGITSVDINFSVASPDGGGIKANGLSYIGLSSVWDISESPEINEFYAGQTFTEGRAIFAMVKGVSDYVFEVTYYGDSSEAHTSYVQGV